MTGFFLFMSVLDNLMPGKAYSKYIRLFAGMILVFLVFQPLAGGFHLEDRIAHFYEQFVFQYEAEDLKREIWGVEQQRLAQIAGEYERVAAEEVTRLAEDMGFFVEECRVEISEDKETGQLGALSGVRLRVREEGQRKETEERNAGAEEETGARTKPKNVKVEPTISIDAVVIGGDTDEEGAARKNGGNQGESFMVKRLRKRIASYYHLEEAYVEIQILEDIKGQR